MYTKQMVTSERSRTVQWTSEFHYVTKQPEYYQYHFSLRLWRLTLSWNLWQSNSFLTTLKLINRGNAHLALDYPFPNTTLKSEFDLTEQIHRAHNIKATFHKTTKFDKLPLFAKLNIEADASAGLYQQEHARHLPKVTLLPSCPAVLHIRGISITSNIRHQLHHVFIEPWCIAHLQEKFGWTDATTELIAWKLLSVGLNS